MSQALNNFVANFKKEIKTVQTYEGERYSQELKKQVAKLCRMKSVSRYMIAEASGINYTLIRNWDLRFNQGLRPDGTKIKSKSEKLSEAKIDALIAELQELKKAA